MVEVGSQFGWREGRITRMIEISELEHGKESKILECDAHQVVRGEKGENEVIPSGACGGVLGSPSS